MMDLESLLVDSELENASFQFHGNMVRGRKLAFVDYLLAVWDWLLQIVGQSSVFVWSGHDPTIPTTHPLLLPLTTCTVPGESCHWEFSIGSNLSSVLGLSIFF